MAAVASTFGVSVRAAGLWRQLFFERVYRYQPHADVLGMLTGPVTLKPAETHADPHD